jgi:hypothetical protein
MGYGSKPLHMLEYHQTPSGGRDLRWHQGYLVLTATRTTVNQLNCSSVFGAW